MHDTPHITLKYSESDVLRSVSNDVVKFDNIKHLSMYIQEEKKTPLFIFMCYVGLTCPKDYCLFDWTHFVVSLPFLFSDTSYSGNINSWRSYWENIVLLVWYNSCAFESFSANLFFFFTVMNSFKNTFIKYFHKQL